MPRSPKRPRSKRKSSPVSPSGPVRFPVEALLQKKGLSPDVKAGDRIRKLFEPMGQAQSRKSIKDGDGRSFPFFHTCYSPFTKKTKITARISPWLTDKQVRPLSRMIHPSLAMYRTLCLFPGAVTVRHWGEESPNAIFLRHITTGQTIGIGEWCGGFRYFTGFSSPKEMPKVFLRDTLKLLDLLLSERCPHPHEGLVAGLVA